ncbi:MAG: hypothetical protein WBE37_20695, partial [Bryobacteraceae bacterium]
MTYSDQAAGASRLPAILAKKCLKIATGEGPLEGRCRSLVVALEGKEPLFEFGQRRKIVGCEDLPLYDG